MTNCIKFNINSITCNYTSAYTVTCAYGIAISASGSIYYMYKLQYAC